MIRLLSTIVLLLVSAVGCVAAEQPTNETGAVAFYSTGGWSFGLPAVQASVAVIGAGSITSPEKKTLPMYGAGINVRAWKFLVPFAEFSSIDTGKAYAQIGNVRSDVQADTFSFISGVRIMSRGTSRLRPYAEFGGGLLHQNLTGTFYENGSQESQNGSSSSGLIKYGGGVQVYLGKRWGTIAGFDGYRVTRPVNGAGQNFSSFKLGFFFQTKSAVM